MGSPSGRARAFGGACRGVRETTRKGTGTGPGAMRSRELKGKRKSGHAQEGRSGRDRLAREGTVGNRSRAR